MDNGLKKDDNYRFFLRSFSLNINELYSREFSRSFDVTDLIGIGENAKKNKILYSDEGLHMRWVYYKRSGEHERKNGAIFFEREKYSIKRPENKNFHAIGKINVVKGDAIDLVCFDFPSLYRAIFKENHKGMPYRDYLLDRLK